MITIKGQKLNAHIEWAEIELTPPHTQPPEVVYVLEAFIEALTKLRLVQASGIIVTGVTEGDGL